MEQICGYLNSGLRGAVGWTALLLFLGLIIWSIGRVATQFDLGTEFFSRFRGIFTTIITTVIIIGYLIPMAGPFLEEVLGVEMPCQISFGASEAPWPEEGIAVAFLTHDTAAKIVSAPSLDLSVTPVNLNSNLPHCTKFNLGSVDIYQAGDWPREFAYG